MKLFVDEMPFWESDCPFFEDDYCRLDGCQCDYMIKNIAGERCSEDCRWLKEGDSE